MKLLHTADWHLGKRLGDYSRLAEQRAVLDEICAIAEAEAVDAVLIAGDLFDAFNPPNEALELFYRTVHRLSSDGARAVIAIAGNHDSPDRVEAPDPLARECGIFFVGRPASVVPTVETNAGIKTLNAAPGFVELQLPDCPEPLRLILTPYANETTLKRFLGDEDRDQSLREVLQHDWQRLADQYCDTRGVNILMAHLYFRQRNGPAPEEPDDEKPILHVGGASAVFTEDIPTQIQYAALGHLHRFQTVAATPCPVCYSSSPLAYSFAEADQQKQVVVIEVEAGGEAQVRPVALRAGRRLCRQRFAEIDAAIAWLEANPNTFVELTLVSDSYLESKLKRALYAAHDGIVSIIPEINASEDASSEPSRIDLSKDLRTLFVDYFSAKKGQEPNDELLTLFDEVLGTESN
ncbi:MAG: exonuclease SbcCD subunit D [Tunicatimonas sp.]